jgi:hypothetical protein
MLTAAFDAADVAWCTPGRINICVQRPNDAGVLTPRLRVSEEPVGLYFASCALAAFVATEK